MTVSILHPAPYSACGWCPTGVYLQYPYNDSIASHRATAHGLRTTDTHQVRSKTNRHQKSRKLPTFTCSSKGRQGGKYLKSTLAVNFEISKPRPYKLITREYLKWRNSKREAHSKSSYHSNNNAHPTVTFGNIYNITHTCSEEPQQC
jgi:hypothetical protein